MKSKEQKFLPKQDFEVPNCFKGGTCRHCTKPVPNYLGFRLGVHVYCDFSHYVAYRESHK